MGLDLSLYFEIPTAKGEEHYRVFARHISHSARTVAIDCSDTLYNAIWHPYNLFDEPTAKQLIPLLKIGLEALNSTPMSPTTDVERARNHTTLVNLLREYVAACEYYPEAKVSAGN